MSLDVGVTSLVRDAGLGTLELSMAVFIADTDTAYWRQACLPYCMACCLSENPPVPSITL